MDEPNSLEKRYSFNIAQSHPDNESTQLNGSSFSWGSSMGPKHRSYSSSYISNGSFLSYKTKNLTKIDARIAADVQSKGLASRIVKYHESGTRLNRSMSAHNLYSKPGQFPVVTLKKTELPYRAAKQELSMIRIPPPEKSSFYGNTISSLLRSSSVIGLQLKRNEDLSRENRPIIHPPPTEDDMAPTRSVLDVLKEISRKRINSDNLESEETSKKYCSRGGNDFLDTANNNMSAIQSSYIASALSCQRYKRQRDCITPYRDAQVPEAQTSPEQAKKRVCNYNNDITSSLSSSKKWKRASEKHSLNQTLPTNFECYEIQMSKMNQSQDYYKNKDNIRVDMRCENLENNLKKVYSSSFTTHMQESHCAKDQNNALGSIPHSTLSEPLYNSDQKITKNLMQVAHQPRLTLFNKLCDDGENKLINESSVLDEKTPGDANEQNDCVGISFVKPKKIASKSGLRNPLMERTQKSKLALMLSGLKGELYVSNDVDELDSPSNKDKLQSTDDNIKNIDASACISTEKSTITTNTLTTVTSSSNVETPISSNLISLSTKTSSSPSSNFTGSKTSSPLVGLKLSTLKSPTKNISNTLCVDEARSTEPSCKPNIPVLGGFSFCTTDSALGIKTTSNNTGVLNTTTTISPVTKDNDKILNFGRSTDSLTLEDKINNMQNSVNVQTSTPSTTNTITSLNTANSLTFSQPFTFGSNIGESPSAGNSSTCVGGNISLDSAAKTNSSFSFAVPSTSLMTTATSSGPLTLGTFTCSPTLETKIISSTIAATEKNAITVSTVLTSENLCGSTSKPSFSFNTNKKISTTEAALSSIENSNINSPITFGINPCTTKNTLPVSSSFSFSSDTKSDTVSSGNQTNEQVANQIGKSTSKVFSPQCLFSSKATEGPGTIFGNISNRSENVANSSDAAPNIDPNFVNGGPHAFGTMANNKSAVLGTLTGFNINSKNNSAVPLFNFGSKSATSPTSSTNNVINPGGFSFSSAVSNNGESGTFGSNGQTNILTNNFLSDASATISHNSFKFEAPTNNSDNSANIFGVAANIGAESSTSPGGFSFGSVTSMKNTFTFGKSKDSSSSVVNNANNSSTAFAFGAHAAAKTNEISNKPFSFSSPQSAQQQKQIQPMATSNGTSLNIFDVSGITNKTAQPTAFNFNAGTVQSLQSNAPTINMFAPSPSSVTTGPGDRPIRRATRRLQK